MLRYPLYPVWAFFQCFVISTHNILFGWSNWWHNCNSITLCASKLASLSSSLGNSEIGSGLHEKVTWNKNNLLEGKRKAVWKVKQRDYNIQKANILSFLACLQTPPSPQIFSEGRRGGGGVCIQAVLFKARLYCLPSSKVLLYHVTVLCKGPIWAVSTLNLTCRLQVTLLILLGQHWPRLYHAYINLPTLLV